MTVRQFINCAYVFLTDGMTSEQRAGVDAILTGKTKAVTPPDPEPVSRNTKGLMALMAGMSKTGELR